MEKGSKKLSQLQVGDKAYISNIGGDGAFRKRITEMGFVVGKRVKLIKKAPLQDPIEYNIMGYNVSIRNKEAELIDIVPDKFELDNEGVSLDGLA